MKWAIFVSGEGTTLQYVLDLEVAKKTAQKIVAVHADRPCTALIRAEKKDKKIFLYSPKQNDYAKKVIDFLKEQDVEAIFLLGYRCILKPDFLTKIACPIVNLHPSLLPDYKGLRAIERAFEAKEKQMGVSIHEVTEDLDAGRVRLQRAYQPNYQIEGFSEVYAKIRSLEKEAVEAYLKSLDCE